MLDIFYYIGYMSIFKYASEILVANEFRGLELTCSNDSSELKHVLLISVKPLYQCLLFWVDYNWRIIVE